MRNLLGKKVKERPGTNLDSSDSNPYYAEPVRPATSYVTASAPLSSTLEVAPTSVNTRSSVVNRAMRMDGLSFMYSHGADEHDAGIPKPGPASGMVEISSFQKYLVHLFDAQFNSKWYTCFPRNLGLSFRVSQLETRITGGPGPSAMRPRPRFKSVIVYPRYNATPSSYPAEPTKE